MNGMKETEIGVIPEEWEEYSFPFTIIKSKAGKKNQINASEFKKTGKYPVVDQSQKYIAGFSDADDKVFLPETPVVVFGDHTRCFKYVDFPFIIGADGTKILTPKTDLFVPKFFYFYLIHLNIPSKGYNRHYKLLQEQKVLCPPLPEQRNIAHVLALIQRAIAKQEELLRTTTELKHALMQKLFTEGLSGEAQKETEIGLIPESWDVVELSKLFDIKHGYAFKGEFFASEGKYIVLTPGHFFEEGGFRDQKEKTKFYSGEIPSDYILEKDDLLVVMTEQKAGLIGSSALVPESDRYLHNQRLGLIQHLDTSRLDKFFLFYFFNTAGFRQQVFLTAAGSKVRHTSPRKILETLIALPKLEEQSKIFNVLLQIDKKLNIVKEKKLLLSDLFKSMLHQLMTGQLRVNQIVFNLEGALSNGTTARNAN